MIINLADEETKEVLITVISNLTIEEANIQISKVKEDLAGEWTVRDIARSLGTVIPSKSINI